MAGNPVEWADRYALSDEPPETSGTRMEDPPRFAHYQNRVADLAPRSHEMTAGTHPFPTRHVRRTSSLTFNVAGYSRQLVNDFLVEGGKIEHFEFRSPSELAGLPQKVIHQRDRLWGTSLVERRVDRAGTWADRVVDSAAGSELWRAVQERLCPRPSRRNSGARYGDERRDGGLQRLE